MGTMIVNLTFKRLKKYFEQDRLISFAQHLWHRFVDDRCFETAGALAYTTIFALVPLSAVAFTVVSVFPIFQAWNDRLIAFVFESFVPEAAQSVSEYLLAFARTTKELSVTGLLALLASVLLTMAAIESTFNRIWRVPKPRPKLWRLVVFWTILTLGFLLLVASLTLSGSFISVAEQEQSPWYWQLTRWLPTITAFLVFSVAYVLIPNRTVRWHFAAAGGFLATLLFELAKFGFSVYLKNAALTQLYGALALVPIFLIWVWLSWVVILLGASFAASLSGFRYQPVSDRLPPGAELYGCLRLIWQLESCRKSGGSLHIDDIRLLEPSLSDDLIQRFLAGLNQLQIVSRNQEGAWLLSRDLAHVPLKDLHTSLELRVPTEFTHLPGQTEPAGRMALAIIEHLRGPLNVALSADIGQFIGSTND